MPSKLQIYMERADAATLRLTENYQTWTEFLVTAGRVYKYNFLEQAMIYAQRPDAIACAGYDLWKNRMRRYVHRGTTGIGLISYIGGKPVLRFVFDVSDTGMKEGALYLDLWQYRSEHGPAVTAALEARYRVPGQDGLVKQLARLAVRFAGERWDGYREDILSAAKGSFLEELDDLNISQVFQRFAAASIAYTLVSRCGMDPELYFEPEDFQDIYHFNTVPVITQIGETVSEAAGQVLRQIEAVVKNLPVGKPAAREKTAEPRPKAQENPKPKDAGTRKPDTEQKPEQKPEPETAKSAEAPFAVSDFPAQETMFKPPEAPQRASKPVPEAIENFRIRDDALGTGGPKTRFRANIGAITTLHAMEREGRNATSEEQEILSRYAGWGSLADAFDPDKTDWTKEYRELNTVLTPDEYASAQASVLNSHYTSLAVIKAMYAAIGNMGFKAGNILEPSCGVGNFFGLLPEDMAKSKLYGVELDSITGRIAQQLYPKAQIQVTGYENTGFPKDFFDLANAKGA